MYNSIPFKALSLVLLAAMACSTGEPVSEGENPRFGVWQMDSDASPPAINIMTYEPYGENGMRVTVESTNSEGRESKWGYVTLFDGEFMDVEGQENSSTAVEIVDDKINKISNMRNGEVTQTIMNVLSEDGNIIDNEYIRTGPDGERRVSHAIYRRIN
jgi:hypothetical protein